MIKRFIKQYQWRKFIKHSGAFDIKYYLFNYPDVRFSDVDPIAHYVKHGANEGRNPSDAFDTRYYLNKNPDVQASGVNPFYHWLRFGKEERRSSKEIVVVPTPNDEVSQELFIKEEPYQSWLKINQKANQKNFTTSSLDPNPYYERFERLIASKKVISFDIFDTLIERTFIDPHALFDAVEMSSKEKIGFRELRVEAELLARKESDSEEITLDAIYETLEHHFNIDSNRCETFKAKELEFEKQSLIIKPFGKRLWEIAKAQQKEILLISDMYLPKAFILEVLNDLGFEIEEERFYLSCEEQATKHHGSLFQKIQTTQGIDASRWLHVGDNLHSDIHIPSTLGIATFLTQNSAKVLMEHYAKVGITSKTMQTSVEASSLYGLLAHQLYGINQLPSRSFYDQDTYRIGYETLGVVFVGFLNYLYKTIQASSYEQIFFVSRDGFYLKIIYDHLRTLDDTLPPSHYLLSSRLMMYSASLIDADSIAYVANKDYFPTTLKHLLEVRFNFDETMLNESQGKLKAFGFASFEDEVRQELNHQNYVDFVLAQKAVIIAKNAQHQANFLEYIQESGVNENSLLVDIGYAGSLQKSLLTLTKQKIDALYFVTNSKIEALSQDGLKHYAYIDHSDPLASTFFQYVQLFELFFSATHPSVVALEKEAKVWKPIFDTNGFSAKSNEVLAFLHYGAVTCVQEYLKHHYELFTQGNYAPKMVMQNILSFFANPSTLDAKLFDEIVFEDNFGANRYALITRDLDRLGEEDAQLLAHGIWAAASRVLEGEAYVQGEIEPSNAFTDTLTTQLETVPYYTTEILKQEVPTAKQSFFKLIIHTDEEHIEALMESLEVQHYRYFSVLLLLEEEVSTHLKERIIFAPHVEYRVGSIQSGDYGDEAWVILAKNSVAFEPNFLSELERAVQKGSDLIYMDEDDYLDGSFSNPQFKPDFSPELLLSQPYYLGSVIACKVKSLGEISTEWLLEDIVFDALMQKKTIEHLPKILYHNLEAPKRKDYQPLIENYLDAIALPYERVYEQAFSLSSNKPVYSVKFPDTGIDIAIIIPTKNRWDILKVALDSLEMTTYQNYKVYIIDNDSDEADILEYFAHTKHTVFKISSLNGIFSYSYVNNEAAKMVEEDYVLFLNNDVKVITPEWLSQMAGLMQIEGIGSVGARLYYGNDLLQHVGITNHVAPYGLPAPSFKLIEGTSSGYLDYAKSIKNFAAMTAACMLTKKELFLAQGGFDDEDFSVAYNDCDYGFKLTQAGYRNVVAPNAELYHYEGVTRGIGVGNDKPSEEAAFVRKYKNWQDPYYNPNLTTMGTDFSVRATLTRSTPDQAFRLLMVSHNYQYEGASLIAFEIAKALKKSTLIEPVILSYEEGPLQEAYAQEGIETHTMKAFGGIYFAPSQEVYNGLLWEIEQYIHTLNVHVLFANTILSYWAIEVAHRRGIPAIWVIHESEPPFEHLREHGSFIESRGIAAMQYAYKNIFVAQSTRELFEPYNFKNNFEVIYNGFDTSRVSIAMDTKMRRTMRQKLGIEEQFVFICPGIVSPRKAQMDAIKAFEQLPKNIQSRIVVLIVGDRVSEYSSELHAYHAQCAKVVQNNVRIIPETKTIGDYYNAADAFLFTSHLESFPKVIQEAMYLGLPIVSTNTFGIKEQVFHNSSALLCDVGDIDALAKNMQRVFEDETLQEKLVGNATSALEKLPTYEEMVAAYHEIFQQAYLLNEGEL